MKTPTSPAVPAGRRLLSGLSILLLLLAAASHARAEENWMRVATARSDSDVSLWTRYIPGYQMKQFRGETHVPVPMDQIFALLLDTDAMPGWIWRCDNARILAKVSPNEYIVYMRFRMFWPLVDRDAVLRVVATHDAKTGTVTLTGSALPDYLPKMQGVVRVPAIDSTIALQPEPQKVRVEMTGHLDPGGVVPQWATNLFVTIFPRHSLIRMREVLEGPYYTAGPRLKAGKDALAEITVKP